MKVTTNLQVTFCAVLALFGILLTNPTPARAALDPVALTIDLDSLSQQGNDLVNTINNTILTPFTVSSQLGSIETEMLNYNNSVNAVYNNIVAAGSTMALGDNLLLSLQTLSSTQVALSQATMGLSAQLAAIAGATMGNSFYTVLRLADDIGTMANRILEMADKILVMADNIGLMADRILETQVIQNNNIKLVVDASLQTQRNMITVFELFSL